MRTVSPNPSEGEGIVLRPALRTSPFVKPTGDARIALLSRLIDHAPLFPPASLDLPDAVEENHRARESSSSFMLGRFVCPASRLSELPEIEGGVSVVLDNFESGVWLKPDPRIEAVEIPPGADLAALEGLAVEVYVEIPLDDDLDARLAEVEHLGLRAKVRCSGAPARLGWFLVECRARAIVYKATAGLHHAVRTEAEHGFLNLLAATVFGDEQEALDETEPEAFELGAEGFRWRHRTAQADELRHARRTRLHSIGSCSFFEPVEELEQLGILPL